MLETLHKQIDIFHAPLSRNRRFFFEHTFREYSDDILYAKLCSV